MDRCLSKYYTSVRTLILWNWILFSEKGEVKYLLKDEKDRSLFKFLGIRIFGVRFAAQLAYERIQDDMINVCGISEDFLNIQESEIKLSKMYVKFFEGDRKQLLLIEIEEMELEKMKAKSKVNKNDNLLNSLNRIEALQNGCRYNPKEITFYEFTELAKLVSKNNK